MGWGVSGMCFPCEESSDGHCEATASCIKAGPRCMEKGAQDMTLRYHFCPLDASLVPPRLLQHRAVCCLYECQQGNEVPGAFQCVELSAPYMEALKQH